MPPADDGATTCTAISSTGAATCTAFSNHLDCPHCRKSDTSPSQSHSSAISDTNSEKLRRIIFASLKGFSIGSGLKGGLSLFSLLARLSRRKSSKFSRNGGGLSSSEEITSVIKETLRYGLFLGTFAGTFTSIDEFIASFGGHRRTAKWRALVAGGIAGPSLLLTGLNTQHNSLTIYILMRAAVLASRCGIKSKRFGRICKPLTWSHGDIFLMCLSSSQILSAYILNQESLPSSYKSFLNKHGGKDLSILEGVKHLATGNNVLNLDAVEKYYNSLGVDITLDPEMKVPCSMVHAKQSCETHFISFLIQAYKRAVPVYLPVYLVPALIVHRQDLLKRPCSILWKSVFGMARSSLFLSTYCASAWYVLSVINYLQLQLYIHMHLYTYL
ncbi:hypothetical protein RND81_01G170500 [Saponaria officinalis]|uniref:Transmembrane protein 135 N-terminal domain-containing protein n=1 Tax=Saponaria officinalis TaxID=3572 RepID=A0AAW1NAH0_SAPOF